MAEEQYQNMYTKKYTPWVGDRGWTSVDRVDTLPDPAAGREAELVPRWVFVDSALRDVASDPTPDSFLVRFPREMRQVWQTRVVRGVFPNVGAITEKTVFLDIDGMNNSVEVPQNGQSFTAPLGFVMGVSADTVSIDTGITNVLVKANANGVRDRVATLKIALRDENGVLIGLTPGPDWSMVLEFTTLMPKMDTPHF